jgi:hypothetical protein
VTTIAPTPVILAPHVTLARQRYARAQQASGLPAAEFQRRCEHVLRMRWPVRGDAGVVPEEWSAIRWLIAAWDVLEAVERRRGAR